MSLWCVESFMRFLARDMSLKSFYKSNSFKIFIIGVRFKVWIMLLINMPTFLKKLRMSNLISFEMREGCQSVSILYSMSSLVNLNQWFDI